MKKFSIVLAAFLLIVPFTASAAFALTLTNVQIDATSPVYNGWLTEYTISSGDLSWEAFCVEPQEAEDGHTYELSNVPSDDNQKFDLVTKMADQYFSTGGSVYDGINVSQSDYQIAIWHTLGMIGNGATYDGADEGVLAVLNYAGWGVYDLKGSIALAKSDYSQDYLVAAPVPEPATMLLLGTGLIGLAGLSRKKFKN